MAASTEVDHDEFWHSNSPKCGGLIFRRYHLSFAAGGKVMPIYALCSIYAQGLGSCDLGIQFGFPAVSRITSVKRRDILEALTLGEYEEDRAMINFITMIIVASDYFFGNVETSEKFLMSLTYEELFHA